MTARYWLSDWLDENSIRSLGAADRATRNAKSLRSLRRRACEWEPNLDQELAGTTVVAGAGADLYSGLQCPNPVCQKHSIDKLFRRVWHYFDQVVVVDDLTHDLAHHWKPDSEDELRNRLLTRIDVLLHLRNIGAEELVQFREKHTRTSDWRRELSSEHLTAIAKASRGVLNSLRKGTSVGISVSEGTTWVELRFPELSFSQSIGFDEKWASTLTIGELKRAAVDEAWDDEMLFLAGDIIQARKLRSALGCVHATHQRVLASVGEVTPESIAFELNFPILDGVPIATLLKMRRAEADLFSRLRTRLRAAFAEQSANRGRMNSAQLADEIRRDMVEPELRKIRTRLRASERVLARKSAVGLALGSLVTTCGIIAGASPQVSLLGGVATVATATQNAASKHLEGQRDVGLEDLYFLWKAAGHAPGQDE